MRRIVIDAPAYWATGGVEALHQLCYSLRANGFNSVLYFANVRPGDNPIHEAYTHYENPYITEWHDNADDVMVLPESRAFIACTVRLARTCIWWLSVDNYYRNMLGHLRKITPQLNMFTAVARKCNAANQQEFIAAARSILAVTGNERRYSRADYHLVQSEYARRHLLALGMPAAKTFYVSDFLNPDYVAGFGIVAGAKQDIVLFNPKKGQLFTKKLMEQFSAYDYLPLEGYTREQLQQIFSLAKVYIDFGDHPGMDRIPREAALGGCCILISRNGSAAYSEDVPIPERYKIAREDKNIPAIGARIAEIFRDYQTIQRDFAPYRNWICGQEARFMQDVARAFSVIAQDK